MSKIHEEYIKEYIDKNIKTSILSSDLIQVVRKKFPECSDTNIRKIISNSAKKGIIKSSEPITFGNNQYAYFSVKNKFNVNLFREWIQTNKPMLFRAILALSYNNGVMTLNELYKVTGCKIKGSTKTLTVDDIIKELEILNIAEKTTYKDVSFIHYKNISPSTAQPIFDKCLSSLQEESALLSTAITWLKMTNIIDSTKVMFKGPLNSYKGQDMNDTYWDATSFTTTVGYKDYIQNEKTIVVIDFLYHRTYQEFDFRGFLSRFEMSIHATKKGKRRILPIIFAPDFSQAAAAVIKKQGVMMFSINSIFGANVRNIIKSHLAIKNSDTAEIQDIEKLLEEIDRSNVPDNYSNMKGDLFEYLMRPVFEEIWHPILIRHAKKIGDFEFDYIIETKEEYIVIELKGYNADSFIKLGKYNNETKKPEPYTIKWFLSYTFPVAKDYYEKDPERKVKLCYITTAKFTEDALSVLEEKNRSKEKPRNTDCYYDGEKLIKLLKDCNAKKELEVIERYYIKKNK